MRHFAIFAPSLLLLAACGDAAVEEAPEAAPEATDPVSLDLESAAIGVPAQNGFERLDIPFGSMRGATETTLGNILGEALEQGGPNDCGLTFTSYAGITVNFRDDALVGYWAEAPFVPDVTREEMLADPAVTLVEDSTIDGEFTIGQGEQIISGVFAGEDADAAVRALWAGENCIAR